MKPTPVAHRRVVRDFRNGASVADAAAKHRFTPAEAEEIIHMWARSKR